MKVYGVDFTSLPGARKAITYAQCYFSGSGLRLKAWGEIQSFDAFERFLAQPGPWVAGFDFPFGQPRRLVENISWPLTWPGYVSSVAQMTKAEFVGALTAYREARPLGDKQHLRLTDKLAHSCSPMMLFGVPVGKMFFEGAPRLLRSGACIVPCRPNDDPRICVEAYPALVARRWIGGGYKNDDAKKQTAAQRLAREKIVGGLRASATREFSFQVQFGDDWAEACIADGTGDRIDALLCAVQGAWACLKRGEGWGIPPSCDPLEGWIVDPSLAQE